MPTFTTRISDGWERALRELPLAAVPLFLTVLNTDKISRILAFDGNHFGLRLGLPAGVVNLWQFVSIPNESVSIGIGTPESTPLAVVLIPGFLVLKAGLAAGYFGSVRRTLETDRIDFFGSAREHFLPFLFYTLIPFLVILPLYVVREGGGINAVGPAVIVLIPIVIIAAYLFYATPYLVVLRETDLLSALRGSYDLAVTGGPYFRYALGFAGLVLLLSIPMTAVVVNLRLIGIVLGLVVTAPVGLACNIATMRFIADIDSESPTLQSWPQSEDSD
ncbi:MAG: hypothetical protein ABEH59_07880 [Halobacteriales archaeon]